LGQPFPGWIEPPSKGSTMAGFVEDRTEYHLGRREAEELRNAEGAFLNRPRVSIRMRIVVGFLLCFFLMGATALIVLAFLYHARSSIRFLAVTENLTFEIQQARRYEKDFFLYGTNLKAATAHADQAVELLRDDTVNILDVAGEKNLSELNYHLGAYRALLQECRTLDRPGGMAPSGSTQIEKALREHGARLISLARTLNNREAEAANRVLKFSQIVPFIFLALLLLLIFWVAHLLSRTITRSLTRFQGYTRRIAEGDFSPIRPAKPYHDEFSELALATNRMLFELRAQSAQRLRAGKLAAVGTLTTGIAHELNNPLNNIFITAETLMEECKALKDDRKYRLVEDILSEAQRANAIVEGLLDFVHDRKPEMAPIALPDLVEATRSLVQNEMDLRKVTFSFEPPGDLPPVLGAFSDLRQVFLNIFLNAVEAMPDGGILAVRAHLMDEDMVCLEVSDDGTGIPPENLPRIFDPYFTTKGRGKGRGLGLSISYGIVKRHGGEMQVESLSGKGTMVHMCLPLSTGASGVKAGIPDTAT